MKYGEIYLVDFDKTVGHEYKGKRPALIVQSNKQMRMGNLITIMPMTSQTDNCISDDILISKNRQNRLFNNSVIKVYQISSFDRLRFINRIGVAESETMNSVKSYLKKHFDL